MIRAEADSFEIGARRPGSRLLALPIATAVSTHVPARSPAHRCKLPESTGPDHRGLLARSLKLLSATVKLYLATLLTLVACAGEYQGRTDGGPGGDAGLTPDAGSDAGSCEEIAACPVTFRYPAAGVSTVELRGTYAPGGWETGLPLVQNGDWFEASVELADDQVVTYKFVVDGVWVADPNNPDTVDDGFGAVNSRLVVACDDCPTAASFDWRDAVMYFVLVDRFHDFDPSNNDPIGVEAAADFAGGDLAGVLAKIEEGYFDDLGVNVLWLTAPFDNADGAGIGTDGYYYSAYHGYWPSDLEAVESRIGDLADLEAVIAAAHARDLKVVLDYVMNHVHAESPLYSEHPDWFWPLEGCVCGDGCSWDDDYERKKCWFTPYLPDFDFTNTAARAWSVDNAVRWAKNLGLDGYRLDAVKHIETAWLTDLRTRLSAEVTAPGETFYLVGETFTGDKGLIKDYIDPATMLDGQFDFPLRAELARVILRRDGSMNDLVGFLDANDGFYGPGAVMGTFIGNHDLPRSIHLAEDTPLWGPWDGGRERAWTNLPGQPEYAAPYERLLVSYALLLTTPGMPLIYYGDEVGLAGAGDPDNRRFMPWSGLNNHQTWLRDQLARLIELRHQHPALRRGARTTVGVDTNVYVYRMADGAGDLYVALNRGDDQAGAPGLPAGDYTDLLSGAELTAPLDVPARSALILVAR